MGVAHLEYRVYDKIGNPKTPVNQRYLGDLSFGANAGGGYGQLSLDLSVPFEYSLYTQTDIIEIIRYADGVVSLLFAGEFSTPVRTKDEDGTKVSIDAFGLFTVMQKIPYGNGDITGTPIVLMKQIIDYFNTQSVWVGGNSSYITTDLIYYTPSSIQDDGEGSVTVKGVNDSCWSMLKKVAATIQTKEIFVDADGCFYWKKRPTTPTHIVAMDRQTNEFEIKETEVINLVTVERNGGDTNTYTDAPSVALYGTRRGGNLSRFDIMDDATQDMYGNSYIAKHKQPRNEIRAILNNKYNLVIVKPLDTVYFTNTGLELDNELILGIKYSSIMDEMELVFENIDTLNKVFTSQSSDG